MGTCLSAARGPRIDLVWRLMEDKTPGSLAYLCWVVEWWNDNGWDPATGTVKEEAEVEARTMWARVKGAAEKRVLADLGKMTEELSKEDLEALAERRPDILNVCDVIRTAIRVDLGVAVAEAEDGSEEKGLLEPALIEFQMERPGPVGTTWYVVAKSWWDEWEKWTAGSGERPGPIDNRGILLQGSMDLMRYGIVPGRDVQLLTPRAWKALLAWYDGGPELARHTVPSTAEAVRRANAVTATRGGAADPKKKSTTMVATMMSGRSIATEVLTEVELYPLCLGVRRLGSDSRTLKGGWRLTLSRTTTVRALRKSACERARFDEEQVRLWHRTEPSTDGPTAALARGGRRKPGPWLPLPDLDRTLEEVEVQNGGEVLLEQRNVDSTWPLSGFEEAAAEQRQTSTRAVAGSTTRKGLQGLVGFSNLGNTCYMNSALQALAHSPLLRDYFLSQEFAYDINETAKFGLQGQMAVAFADLLDKVWKGDAPVIAPRKMKALAAQARSTFDGYAQHDAHELLECVLNVLSEELNRVREKPYMEQPDSDGRPDPVVAEEWWVNHLRREQSALVSLFTGQFRSLLQCETCGRQSARFEPCLTLNLPLPEPEHRFALVRLWLRSGRRRAVLLSVRVRRGARLEDVIRATVESDPGAFLARKKPPAALLRRNSSGQVHAANGTWDLLVASDPSRPSVPHAKTGEPVSVAGPPAAALRPHTEASTAAAVGRRPGKMPYVRLISDEILLVANLGPQAATHARPLDTPLHQFRDGEVFHLYQVPAPSSAPLRHAIAVARDRTLAPEKDALVVAMPLTDAALDISTKTFVSVASTPKSADDDVAVRPSNNPTLDPTPASRSQLRACVAPAQVIGVTHRKLTQARIYFLEKFGRRNFGTPLLDVIVPDTLSCRALYARVFQRTQPWFKERGRTLPRPPTLPVLFCNVASIRTTAKQSTSPSSKTSPKASHDSVDSDASAPSTPREDDTCETPLQYSQRCGPPQGPPGDWIETPFGTIRIVGIRWIPVRLDDVCPPPTTEEECVAQWGFALKREKSFGAGGTPLQWHQVEPCGALLVPSATRTAGRTSWIHFQPQIWYELQTSSPSEPAIDPDHTPSNFGGFPRATWDLASKQNPDIPGASAPEWVKMALEGRVGVKTWEDDDVAESETKREMDLDDEVLRLEDLLAEEGKVWISAPRAMVRGLDGENVLAREELTCDWDPALHGGSYDKLAAEGWDEHPTVALHARLRDAPLSLSHCLDVFSREEVLDDERFCSRCSRVTTRRKVTRMVTRPGGDVSKPEDNELQERIEEEEDVVMRKHKKKLELWRVQPLLVIQLSRFKHTAHAHRKLYNHVSFPLQGLNLQEFLARRAPRPFVPDLSIWRHLGGEMEEGVEDEAEEARDESVASTPTPGVGETERNFAGIPLLLSRDETTYDLYAIVNHLGAMGAGHYTAFIRGPEGKWYLFDDAHVSPADPREIVTRHAYLLFYVRRDCAEDSIANLFPRTSTGEPADLDRIARLGQSWSALFAEYTGVTPSGLAERCCIA